MTESIRNSLTETQRSQVCEMLSSGGTYEMAADYCGATIEMIRAEETVNPSFAEQTSHARLRSEVNLLARLMHAANDEKQWRAAAWLLERLYPDRYARRRPNTLLVTDHEERMQQIADLVKSVVPDDTWSKLQHQVGDLIRGAPLDIEPLATNEESETKSSSAPGEEAGIIPLVPQSEPPHGCEESSDISIE